MMARYSITSRDTGNKLEVLYDERGLIREVSFISAVERDGLAWIMANLPVQEKGITGWLPGKFDIFLVPDEVKFDVFWEQYGYKVGKVNAMSQWQKLSQSERAKAIRMIPRYHQWRKCKNPPIEAVYPERYLKNRRFDDDFTL